MSAQLAKDKKICAGAGVTKPTKGFSQFCHLGNEAKKIDFLTADEEAILFAWLIADGDTVAGAREVVDACRRDPESRAFFLRQARATL
jgi:hypothetical protein